MFLIIVPDRGSFFLYDPLVRMIKKIITLTIVSAQINSAQLSFDDPEDKLK